jgi:phospholipase C
VSRTRALLGLLVTSVVGISVLVAQGASANRTNAATAGTATPIKHLVVIFQENVSFDHYFGTYPNAANTDGQPFAAVPGTPAVAALKTATDASIPVALQHGSDLTATNPNTALPKRFDSSPTGLPGSPGGEITCDQDHTTATSSRRSTAG